PDGRATAEGPLPVTPPTKLGDSGERKQQASNHPYHCCVAAEHKKEQTAVAMIGPRVALLFLPLLLTLPATVAGAAADTNTSWDTTISLDWAILQLQLGVAYTSVPGSHSQRFGLGKHALSAHILSCTALQSSDQDGCHSLAIACLTELLDNTQALVKTVDDNGNIPLSNNSSFAEALDDPGMLQVVTLPSPTASACTRLPYHDREEAKVVMEHALQLALVSVWPQLQGVEMPGSSLAPLPRRRLQQLRGGTCGLDICLQPWLAGRAFVDTLLYVDDRLSDGYYSSGFVELESPPPPRRLQGSPRKQPPSRRARTRGGKFSSPTTIISNSPPTTRTLPGTSPPAGLETEADPTVVDSLPTVLDSLPLPVTSLDRPPILPPPGPPPGPPLPAPPDPPYPPYPPYPSYPDYPPLSPNPPFPPLPSNATAYSLPYYHRLIGIHFPDFDVTPLAAKKEVMDAFLKFLQARAGRMMKLNKTQVTVMSVNAEQLIVAQDAGSDLGGNITVPALSTYWLVSFKSTQLKTQIDNTVSGFANSMQTKPVRSLGADFYQKYDVIAAPMVQDASSLVYGQFVPNLSPPSSSSLHRGGNEGKRDEGLGMAA
ncbi:hypothetical protein HaLaN_22364, partial [Haematococcus lacustris]